LDEKKSFIKKFTMASQHIKWDEETIAEHDKLRGTRRKIIEADTPYIVYDQNDDTAVEKSKLNNGITPMSASELSAIKQSEKATSLPPGRKEGEPAKLSPAKSPGGGYSLDPDELSSRLQAAVSGGGSGSHGRHGSHGSSGSSNGSVSEKKSEQSEESYQDGPVRRKQSDRKAFLNKRKNHYNEFKMAKMLAAQLMDDDDEEVVGIDSTRK
jgi:hypothetical protein